MGNTELKIVCYANDAIIMAENEANPQRLMFGTLVPNDPTIIQYDNSQSKNQNSNK